MIEVVKEYRYLLNHIDGLIKKSGYKIDYLQSQLGISRASFWKKWKNGKFTIDEMEKLAALIFNEKQEDEHLAELISNEDAEFLGCEESRKIIDAL